MLRNYVLDVALPDQPMYEQGLWFAHRVKTILDQACCHPNNVPTFRTVIQPFIDSVLICTQYLVSLFYQGIWNLALSCGVEPNHEWWYVNVEWSIRKGGIQVEVCYTPH